ncbi:hypothetical protein [Bacillus sp. JJ722]|uniref:hypothetical protein n=1 Tax=Bacillus sp. JJ722 TaxID=3122973 RepID=UPI002FFFA09F
MKNINNDVRYDDIWMMSQMKNRFEEKYVTIPIKAEMLLHLFRKQKIEGISNLDVVINNTSVVVSGMAKKVFDIAFYVEIIPIRAEGRNLYFEIINMKPINQGWIKKKVFNTIPTVSFIKGLVCLNVNEIDKVKAIPFGTIQKMEVKANTLYVGIGT